MKLVTSRLKWAGLVKRMADEQLAKRSDAQKVEWKGQGNAIGKIRQERSGKNGRRTENNSKRQTELETVDREPSERNVRREKTKTQTTVTMTGMTTGESTSNQYTPSSDAQSDRTEICGSTNDIDYPE